MLSCRKKELCISKVFFYWIISTFCLCPSGFTILTHEFITLHVLWFTTCCGFIHQFEKLKISWKEYICLSLLYQIVLEIFMFFWLLLFLTHYWSIDSQFRSIPVPKWVKVRYYQMMIGNIIIQSFHEFITVSRQE